MTEHDLELAYFRGRIRKKYADVLAANGAVPAEAIDEALTVDPFNLEPETRAQIERQLRASFAVQQTVGHAITKGYAPWLRQRTDIEHWYWPRLQRYYLEADILPPHVVGVLDQVTSEVLDYCGNPADQASWSRRGMVLGHVQSGKTTNYSGLICKAADAGYKVIILLAGITNSLRAQTQERIDEAFIGRKSIFGAATIERLPIVDFGEGNREPAFGTTRDQDFNRDRATGYGVTFDALREPIIFVLKKNKSSLESLRDWISNQARGGLIDHPLLLIDDEADNASVNTASSPDTTTAINRVIREILKPFRRSAYVGYTATPFANIFIDPDSIDEMLHDDLFPRHFIKALDPPNNYVGSKAVFARDGRLRETMVQLVDDFEDTLPLKHKRSDPVHELPDSLVDAVRTFVLARAIRVLRGDGTKHCSMMINVSRFNDIQESVYGLVYRHMETLKKAIAVNASAGAQGWQDGELQELRRVFESEYGSSEPSLEDLVPHLHEAARTIELRTVNMRGGELDYSRYARDGLHVVAIGGLALSRGLTLEGLVVSYILRNTAASDTLMQMARWFGYRPGYEDLCRLYLPKSSLEHYEYIHDAIEELRGEIKGMEKAGQTPEQFGLKVRESPTALRITAANKMRAATALRLAQDYSARHLEGYVLHNDADINLHNLNVTSAFLTSLGARLTPAKTTDPAIAADVAKNVAWGDVEGHRVLDLIRKFRFPVEHGDLGPITSDTSLFADYVADRLRADMALWDVVLPLNEVGSLPESNVFPELGPLSVRRRGGGKAQDGVFRVTGGRNRVADPADARLLLPATARVTDGEGGDRAFCRLRRRPLLLVHLFHTGAGLDEPGFADLKIPGLVVSLSFCTPPTGVAAQERLYQVNAVYRKQLELFATEADDDEGMLNA